MVTSNLLDTSIEDKPPNKGQAKSVIKSLSTSIIPLNFHSHSFHPTHMHTYLTVQFDPVTYSVAEGATVSVLNIAADRDVTIDLTAVSGSATGTE